MRNIPLPHSFLLFLSSRDLSIQHYIFAGFRLFMFSYPIETSSIEMPPTFSSTIHKNETSTWYNRQLAIVDEEANRRHLSWIPLPREGATMSSHELRQMFRENWPENDRSSLALGPLESFCEGWRKVTSLRRRGHMSEDTLEATN